MTLFQNNLFSKILKIYVFRHGDIFGEKHNEGLRLHLEYAREVLNIGRNIQIFQLLLNIFCRRKLQKKIYTLFLLDSYVFRFLKNSFTQKKLQMKLEENIFLKTNRLVLCCVIRSIAKRSIRIFLFF